ncbi:MAG: glycosyltransferase family 9 protein, partial [Planctomycetota bacterium]
MALAAITPNWLGDVVMAAPALDALACALGERDPPERLDVYAPEPLAPLVDLLVPDGGTTPFRLRKGLARIRDRLHLAGVMRARAHRSVVLFPNSFGTGLMVRLAKIPERVGTPLHRRGLLITRQV